jgi:formyl-CoA transferase
LCELLEKYGVPNGTIYRAPEMLADAHFKARQAIVEIGHKVFGPLAMQNVAPKLSETPGEIVRPGPELGEHNEEVYGGLLGLSTKAIAELKAEKVI